MKDMLNHRARAALFRCRKRNYESGNKSGRLLPTALKSQQEALFVPKIKKGTQYLTSDPQEIAETFVSYYTTIYNLDKKKRKSENTKRSQV